MEIFATFCNIQILVAVSHDAFLASVPAGDQSRGCQTGYRDDLQGIPSAAFQLSTNVRAWLERRVGRTVYSTEASRRAPKVIGQTRPEVRDHCGDRPFVTVDSVLG